MKSKQNEEERKKAQRVREFFDALKTESQRGKILILAAHVDEVLGEMLRRFAKVPRKDQDWLFSGMGPLGSFAARIELAYRVGLISKDAADCYDILRGIRNRCAHRLEAFSFAKQDGKAFNDFKTLSYKMSGISRLLELVEAIGLRTDDDVFNSLCVVHIACLEAHSINITEAPDGFLRPATLEEQKRFFAGSAGSTAAT